MATIDIRSKLHIDTTEAEKKIQAIASMFEKISADHITSKPQIPVPQEATKIKKEVKVRVNAIAQDSSSFGGLGKAQEELKTTIGKGLKEGGEKGGKALADTFSEEVQGEVKTGGLKSLFGGIFRGGFEKIGATLFNPFAEGLTGALARETTGIFGSLETVGTLVGEAIGGSVKKVFGEIGGTFESLAPVFSPLIEVLSSEIPEFKTAVNKLLGFSQNYIAQATQEQEALNLREKRKEEAKLASQKEMAIASIMEREQQDLQYLLKTIQQLQRDKAAIETPEYFANLEASQKEVEKVSRQYDKEQKELGQEVQRKQRFKALKTEFEQDKGVAEIRGEPEKVARLANEIKKTETAIKDTESRINQLQASLLKKADFLGEQTEVFNKVDQIEQKIASLQEEMGKVLVKPTLEKSLQKAGIIGEDYNNIITQHQANFQSIEEYVTQQIQQRVKEVEQVREAARNFRPTTPEESEELKSVAKEIETEVQQIVEEISVLAARHIDANEIISPQKQLLERLKAEAQQTAKQAQKDTELFGLHEIGITSENIAPMLELAGKVKGNEIAEARKILTGLKKRLGGKEAPQPILDAIESARAELNFKAKDFTQAGKLINQGLQKGISLEFSKLQKVAAVLAKLPVEEVREALEIRSPSQVFMRFGRYISQGLSEGINKGKSYVTTSAGKIIDSVKSQFKDLDFSDLTDNWGLEDIQFANNEASTFQSSDKAISEKRAEAKNYLNSRIQARLQARKEVADRVEELEAIKEKQRLIKRGNELLRQKAQIDQQQSLENDPELIALREKQQLIERGNGLLKQKTQLRRQQAIEDNQDLAQGMSVQRERTDINRNDSPRSQRQLLAIERENLKAINQERIESEVEFLETKTRLNNERLKNSPLYQFKESVKETGEEINRAIQTPFGQKIKQWGLYAAQAAVSFVAFNFGIDQIRQNLGMLIQTSTRLESTQTIFTQFGADLETVTEKALELRVPLEAATSAYGQFLASTSANKNLQKDIPLIWEALAQSASAYNVDAEKAKNAFIAVQQIIGKGTVSAEELRGQLAETGVVPDAIALSAQVLGLSIAEFNKALSQGLITAEELLPKLFKQVKANTSTLAKAAKSTMGGVIQNLKNQGTILQQTMANVFAPDIKVGAEALANALATVAQHGDTIKAVLEVVKTAILPGMIASGVTLLSVLFGFRKQVSWLLMQGVKGAALISPGGRIMQGITAIRSAFGGITKSVSNLGARLQNVNNVTYDYKTRLFEAQQIAGKTPNAFQRAGIFVTALGENLHRNVTARVQTAINTSQGLPTPFQKVRLYAQALGKELGLIPARTHKIRAGFLRLVRGAKQLTSAIAGWVLPMLAFEAAFKYLDQLKSGTQGLTDAIHDLNKAYQEYIKISSKTSQAEADLVKLNQQQLLKAQNWTKHLVDFQYKLRQFFSLDLTAFEKADAYKKELGVQGNADAKTLTDRILADAQIIDVAGGQVSEIFKLRAKLAEGEKVSTKELEAAQNTLQEIQSQLSNLTPVSKTQIPVIKQLQEDTANLTRVFDHHKTKIKETSIAYAQLILTQEKTIKHGKDELFKTKLELEREELETSRLGQSIARERVINEIKELKNHQQAIAKTLGELEINVAPLSSDTPEYQKALERREKAVKNAIKDEQLNLEAATNNFSNNEISERTFELTKRQQENERVNRIKAAHKEFEDAIKGLDPDTGMPPGLNDTQIKAYKEYAKEREELGKKIQQKEIELEKAIQEERKAIFEKTLNDIQKAISNAQQERQIANQQLINKITEDNIKITLTLSEALEAEKIKRAELTKKKGASAIADQKNAIQYRSDLQASINQTKELLDLQEEQRSIQNNFNQINQNRNLIVNSDLNENEQSEQLEQLNQELLNLQKERLANEAAIHRKLTDIQQKEAEKQIRNKEKQINKEIAAIQRKQTLLGYEKEQQEALNALQKKGSDLQIKKLSFQTRILQTNNSLLQEQQNTIKALTSLSNLEGDAELSRLQKARELVAQLANGENLSLRERRAITAELSRLGISGFTSEKQILREIGELQQKQFNRKMRQLEQEQQFQRESLALEREKARIAAEQAVLESQITQQQARIDKSKLQSDKAEKLSAIEELKTRLKSVESEEEKTKILDQIKRFEQQLGEIDQQIAHQQKIINLTKSQTIQAEKELEVQGEITKQKERQLEIQSEIKRRQLENEAGAKASENRLARSKPGEIPETRDSQAQTRQDVAARRSGGVVTQPRNTTFVPGAETSQARSPSPTTHSSEKTEEYLRQNLEQLNQIKKLLTDPPPNIVVNSSPKIQATTANEKELAKKVNGLVRKDLINTINSI